jgi:hypothetical protein
MLQIVVIIVDSFNKQFFKHSPLFIKRNILNCFSKHKILQPTHFKSSKMTSTVKTPAIAISQAPNALPEQNAVNAASIPPTYLDEPPHYNFQDMTPADQKELLQDAKSDISASSSQTTLALPSTFIPAKKLLN